MSQIENIATGKRADLIVLGRNTFEISPEQVGDIRVLETLFEARVVVREAPASEGRLQRG